MMVDYGCGRERVSGVRKVDRKAKRERESQASRMIIVLIVGPSGQCALGAVDFVQAGLWSGQSLTGVTRGSER